MCFVLFIVISKNCKTEAFTITSVGCNKKNSSWSASKEAKYKIESTNRESSLGSGILVRASMQKIDPVALFPHLKTESRIHLGFFSPDQFLNPRWRSVLPFDSQKHFIIHKFPQDALFLFFFCLFLFLSALDWSLVSSLEHRFSFYGLVMRKVPWAFRSFCCFWLQSTWRFFFFSSQAYSFFCSQAVPHAVLLIGVVVLVWKFSSCRESKCKVLLALAFSFSFSPRCKKFLLALSWRFVCPSAKALLVCFRRQIVEEWSSQHIKPGFACP